MTTNDTPAYENRDWLTIEEELELAKEEREWLEENEVCWEELND